MTRFSLGVKQRATHACRLCKDFAIWDIGSIYQLVVLLRITRAGSTEYQSFFCRSRLFAFQLCPDPR